MMRAVLAACCLLGIVLGGAFAPAVGIQTPIPDLGVEGDGEVDVGGGLGNAANAETGDNDSGGSPGEPGVGSYGGVSGGGYPGETTVGGRLELSDHEELVVESPEPSRWRLGAYGTYTGAGWDRENDRRPVTDSLSTAADERPPPQYEIRVTPRRPVERLATVWRPAVAGADDRQVYVDDNGGLSVDEPLDPDEEYVTVTYGPPSREAAAAAEGDDYPPAIEERYTALPEETPDRLTERTDEITADAETPYESARAVETWLETNKEYSLNASHDRGTDVATAFVFEMDAGYCQYFATAMAAMLRTQGIPTRYVTGYSTGEAVGEDRYLVRGSNAHAWVEVYVADVGWVPFDPTPAEGREAAGRGATPPEAVEGEPDPDEAGEESEAEATPERAQAESESVNVVLTPEPIPGREVTATVTRRGDPVAGATVLFNGAPVGETDATGNVTGEVPYEGSLEVEVRLDEASARLAGVGGGGGRGGAFESVAEPTQLAAEETITFDVPTDVAIEVRGDARPGASVEVVATIDGEPVPEGDVALDGRSVATTDADGRATVTLPDADAVEIAVERGDARGNRTLELRSESTAAGSLNVSVAPSLGAAVPGTPATVAVERDGEPVPNATVAVGGDVVGETGPGGVLEVDLPVAASTTVVATAGDDGDATTGETSVEGMYRNLAVVLAASASVLLAFLGAAARRGLEPRGLRATARRVLTRAASALVAGIVGLAAVTDSGFGALREWANRGREILRSPYARAVSAVRRALRLLDPRDLRSRLRGLGVRRPGATDGGGVDGSPPADRSPTVREAWDELRGHVTVRSWSSSTPGEIARWAVARDGLPRDAVATLRDAFREVEYGARSPEDRAPAAREALEEIRRSRRVDESGADGDGSGDGRDDGGRDGGGEP